MGLFDFFKKPPRPPPPSAGGFDGELLRRLDTLAVINAKVRHGQLPGDRVMLAMNVNAEGALEANRPTVQFKLSPGERRGDCWTLLGAIDDPTGWLRFHLELDVPEGKPLSAEELDLGNLPGIKATFRRHEQMEDGTLARGHCLMHWRAETPSDFLTAQGDPSRTSGTLVMGTRLQHQPVCYQRPGEGNWVLLKCDAPGPFFVGFNPETGEAEMFPRRFDTDGYAFALSVLQAIA